MDRQIADDVRAKRTIKRVVTVLIALAAIVFGLAATIEWLRPSVRRRDIQAARVARGAVDATLQAAGTIVAAGEQVVPSPVEARVLRIEKRAGDRVRKGDPLVALDTNASRLDLDRLDGQVAQKESALAQLRLRLDDALAAQRSIIEQKKLDGEILRFKAEQNAKLAKEGLIAKQEDLTAATAAKKNDIELVQLRDALGRAARSAGTQLAAAGMELNVARKERDASRRQLELAMMRADRDGVITWIVEDAGANVRRGDPVARIADLSSYRVVSTISDIHATRLARGMRVRVRADDATVLAGTIAGVEPRAEGGQAKFWVDLDQPSHPSLRNNVRVDVSVIAGRHDNVLRVRRGALGDAARDAVFVVRGDRLVRVPATFGLAGDETIEITGGLAAGDEVVISNMTDYASIRSIRLK